MPTAAPPLADSHPPWLASLTLGFERNGAKTLLRHNRHVGPLRVQKALYPEGPERCHAIVLHPPAGIVGGDSLTLDIEIGPDAQALLTTPGAGKWYRTAEREASQQVRIKVGAGGTVEWLPQENILFAAARASLKTDIDLALGARYLGIDTLCFGRQASGEKFDRGHLRIATDIRIDGAPIWCERGTIHGGSPQMSSPTGLARHSVCSTLILAGAEIDRAALAACRAAVGDAPHQGLSIVMPNLLVGRWLGDSGEAARAWFLALWRILRPGYLGGEAAIPRIWNT